MSNNKLLCMAEYVWDTIVYSTPDQVIRLDAPGLCVVAVWAVLHICLKSNLNQLNLDDGRAMLDVLESGYTFVDLDITHNMYVGTTYIFLVKDDSRHIQEYTVDAEIYTKAYEIWKSDN